MVAKQAQPNVVDIPPAAVITVGVILGLAATALGLPGGVLVWLSAVIAGALLPHPAKVGKLTGGTGTRAGAEPNPDGSDEPALAKHRIWHDIAKRLLIPGAAWLPGDGVVKPVQVSWAVGLAAGLAALMLPVRAPWWALVNAVCIAAVVWQVASSRRRHGFDPAAGDPCPGVTLDHLDVRDTEKYLPGVIGGGLVGALLGWLVAGPLGTAAVAAIPTPSFVTEQNSLSGTSAVSPLAWVALPLAGALAGLLIASRKGLREASLADWEARCQARADWNARWTMVPELAKRGVPRLIGHEEVGAMAIDTFDLPGGMGVDFVYETVAKKDALRTALGAGDWVHALLPVPNTNPDGSRAPGYHPSRVRALTCQGGLLPSVTDPDLDENQVRLVLELVLNRAAEQNTWPRIEVTDLERVPTGGDGRRHVPLPDIPGFHDIDQPVPENNDAPAASSHGRGGRILRALFPEWDNPTPEAPAQPETFDGDLHQDHGAVVWRLHVGGGPGLGTLRAAQGDLSAGLGCEVIVDPAEKAVTRAREYFRGWMTLGALDEVGYGEIPTGQVVPLLDGIKELRFLAEWERRWEQALKKDMRKPQPQWKTNREIDYFGATIKRCAFMTLQGINFPDYFGFESQLATTLDAARLIAFTGFFSPVGGGTLPGERREGAFTVTWSNDPLPRSPERLVPVTTGGARRVVVVNAITDTQCNPEHIILAAIVNRAFTDSRLDRPETYEVRCLTAPDSPAHIWHIGLRLYGATTLDKVRKAQALLATKFGCPWIRVEVPETQTDAAFVNLLVGAKPEDVVLADPTTMVRLEDLDWQAAFEQAGAVTLDGAVPRVTDAARMPRNPKVKVIDLWLPPGMSNESLEGRKAKLRTATGNTFVEFRPGVGDASTLRMLTCPVDPMPFPALMNYDAVSGSKPDEIVFATGVDGDYVSWKASGETNSLLTVGGAGSGKSASLQAILYGVVASGADLWIGDAMKAAADFGVFEPYARCVARNVAEMNAMVVALWEDFQGRKDIMSRHRAGSWTEVPLDVRRAYSPHDKVFVFVDEFNGLLGAERPDKPKDATAQENAEYEVALADYRNRVRIADSIGKLVLQARAAGFSVVVAAQKLTAEMLKLSVNAKAMRGSMARIGLGKMTYPEMQTAMKDANAQPDLGDFVPQGRGRFEGTGPSVAIQSWFDPSVRNPSSGKPDMQLALAGHLARVAAPVASDRKIDLDEVMARTEREITYEGQVLSGPVVSDGVVAVETVTTSDGEVAQVTTLAVDDDLLDDLDFGDDDFDVDQMEVSGRESQCGDALEVAEPDVIPDGDEPQTLLDLDFGFEDDEPDHETAVAEAPQAPAEPVRVREHQARRFRVPEPVPTVQAGEFGGGVRMTIQRRALGANEEDYVF